MAIDATTAAKLYALATKGMPGASETQDGEGFGALLQSALANATEPAAAMEAKVSALGTNNVDIVDLVTAVAQTEVAVETLVTVRDRVISAYQEILNMPI